MVKPISLANVPTGSTIERRGDGRVFVVPVEHSYNIRTGERDV